MSQAIDKIDRMLLAYVDESYNDSRFFLSALVVDDIQGQTLITALDKIVADAVPDGVPPQAELHGSEMFHGNNHWRHLPPWLRVHVYREATDAIAAVDAACFFSGVDLASLARTEYAEVPPHEIALRFLLESLQTYAENRGELVLTIADEIHTAERHRTKLRDYRVDEPSDVRWSRLDRIFDTLYFGPSKHSRLLQAADLLTYIYLRRTTVIESSPKATLANERIWKPLTPKIIAETMYPGPGNTKAPIG